MPDILTKQDGPILGSAATRCPMGWSPTSPGLQTTLARDHFSVAETSFDTFDR